MRRAIEIAGTEPRPARPDVPVGALIVDASGAVIAEARNEKELRNDPTAHAEVLAIRAAAERLGDRVLAETILVVTLEPCVMCAGAIAAARIPRVVFGAWDEKAGAAGSMYDILRDRRLPNRTEVIGGVLETEAAEILRAFFAERRGDAPNLL
ncbi:MAG TPA: nucleoside deaminase [Microbacteriaceae bacterium]|nr:nucleoside deaminase [Microbacteriaceae bacterium]